MVIVYLDLEEDFVNEILDGCWDHYFLVSTVIHDSVELIQVNVIN